MKVKPNTIICGDIRKIAKKLPAQSVNCIITSPPYWALRDYGHPDQIGKEETPELYIETLVGVFRDLRRVLRDDGTLWLNLGDSYSSGFSGQSGQNPSSTMNGPNKGAVRNGRASPVAGMRPKNLLGIPWRVALALQADGWYLRCDIIWHKCLSGGAVVYAKTQKGEMPMTIKDMVRLDPSTVKLWTGEKWSQVVGWEETRPAANRKQKSQLARSACYRGENPGITGDLEIELRNGEKIGCTREHRWPTERGIVEAQSLTIGDVIKSTTLPDTEAKAPKHLPDDIGWFIGLYIAEGSRGKGGDVIQIAGNLNELGRFERLKKFTADYGGTCQMHKTSDNGATINIYSPLLSSIVDLYINGNSSRTKHLSPRCWQRNNDFLTDLLEGYLSGDGHFDKKNNRWRIGFTNNDALAQDLRTIGARLGYSIRLKRATHTFDGRKFPGWRGSLVYDPTIRRNNDYEIVAIRQSRARKFWDISIEDDPHLFSLASGALTHNSNPMPESVTDRPTKAHEYVFLLSRSERYYYDYEAIKEPANYPTGSGWKDKKQGDFNGKYSRSGSHQKSFRAIRDTRNRRTVWTVATQSYSEAHFAVFPPALIKPCVLAGCPEGGIVFDPFIGSGTVAQVAIETQRNWLGCEINKEYIDLAYKRINELQVELIPRL